MVRDDFHLEGGMDIGMKEAEEGVEMETMEVAGAMVGVTLMAGLSLEAGVATEKDFQAAEVMDISGLIMQVAMVAVQIVLVDWLLTQQPELLHLGYLLLPKIP